MDRPQITTWRMRIASWIPNSTNTHSEYVIVILFPLQQWLHERPSMLHYALYIIACLVTFTCKLMVFRPYHGPGVDSAPSENEY
jgi:hypothetical protein